MHSPTSFFLDLQTLPEWDKSRIQEQITTDAPHNDISSRYVSEQNEGNSFLPLVCAGKVHI